MNPADEIKDGTCKRCGGQFFREIDELYKCNGCGREIDCSGGASSRPPVVSIDDGGRAGAFAEVRALVVGVDTRNPWTTLQRVTELVGGSSPSEWAEHLARVEAKPITWSVSPAMRQQGYRGVRSGDLVPCPTCDGNGYHFQKFSVDGTAAALAHVTARAMVCVECKGEAFVEVG